MTHRQLMRFMILLGTALAALATVSSYASSSSPASSAGIATLAYGSISTDIDDDNLDDEYNAGIDAVINDDKGKKKGGVVDDLGLDEEEVEDVDYTDTDADDLGKDGKKKKRAANKDDGVLPELAEQADRLLDQSNKLSEESEFFKTESAAISHLPKTLLETSARLSSLAKNPSWKASALMFNTQAKKLKEQSRRIQDLLTQMLNSIPDYEKESAKLAKQAESLKEIADNHVLQGMGSDDSSVLDLRKEVKGLEKDYAKMLKKSNELRKNIKQLKEQGDAVNKLASSLPEDGDKASPKAATPQSSEL